MITAVISDQRYQSDELCVQSAAGTPHVKYADEETRSSKDRRNVQQTHFKPPPTF